MNITILGCGVYGMALAKTFLDKNNKVCIWSKFEKEVIEYEKKYLSLKFTTDLELAVKGSDLIVIAIPVAFLGDTMKELKEYYMGQDILIASKGIDTTNKLFAYEIVKEHLSDVSVGVISGGTFACDMANRKVMGITLATDVDSIRNKVKLAFESDFLKVQYIKDIVGVSVCGAIKNVMAIGFGMLDGANYPPSSKFLFLTEAIYEIRNLIVALGGNIDTVMSYAGIDDIMMTCTSVESRNYTLGSMLGKRMSNEQISNYKATTTIEGLGTSKAIYKLANDKNIRLPLSEVIYKILYDNMDINELVTLLEKRES